jgi:hypothetical protein
MLDNTGVVIGLARITTGVELPTRKYSQPGQSIVPTPTLIVAVVAPALHFNVPLQNPAALKVAVSVPQTPVTLT